MPPAKRPLGSTPTGPTPANGGPVGEEGADTDAYALHIHLAPAASDDPSDDGGTEVHERGSAAHVPTDEHTPANGSSDVRYEAGSIIAPAHVQVEQTPANGSSLVRIDASARRDEFRNDAPVREAVADQSANNRREEGTPPADDKEGLAPLSRVGEALAIAELRLVEGSAFEIVWRVRETDATNHGPWHTTRCSVRAVDYDPTGREKYSTRFLWEGEPCEGTLPLQWEYEMASARRVKGEAPPPTFKRARVETGQVIHQQGTTQQQVTSLDRPEQRDRGDQPCIWNTKDTVLHQSTFIQQASVLASATAQAQLDVTRGTVTVEVHRGDGLRVPAQIAKVWLALYPPHWLARKAAGEAADDLELAWRESVALLQTHLGATFKNPSKRESYLTNVENLVSLIYRQTPDSRVTWRTLFHNAALVGRDYVAVCASQPKAAEDYLLKFGVAFTKGFINFEELMLASWPTADKDETQSTTTQSTLAAENKALKNQIAALGNRGRGGYFRGGRGSRNRGRGGDKQAGDKPASQ
jgi:hypothetical protein